MAVQWHQTSLKRRQEGRCESSMHWVFVWNGVTLMTNAFFLLLSSHWCPCIFSNMLHTMFFSHCSAVLLCILVYMMYFTCVGFPFFVLLVNLKSSLPVLSRCILLSVTSTAELLSESLLHRSVPYFARILLSSPACTASLFYCQRFSFWLTWLPEFFIKIIKNRQ